jgi:hypothetical protein
VSEEVFDITAPNNKLEAEKNEAVDKLIQASDNIVGDLKRVIIKPYLKSAAFRWGLVIVAITIVKTTGKIIIERGKR